MSRAAADDPVIRQLREQISALDRSILDAVNERLQLVEKIKAYKDSRGLDFHDPEREASMLRELKRANRGPLSGEGVQQLLHTIVDLSKREVSREGSDGG